MSKHFGPKSYLSPYYFLKRSAALGAIVSVAALSSCAAPQAPSPLIGSEPAAGAVITDRFRERCVCITQACPMSKPAP
jgi:hypothetical protein